MHGWIELPNMIINDDITISEIPNKRVKIKCEFCIRRGLFRKTELMARFGSVTRKHALWAAVTQVSTHTLI